MQSKLRNTGRGSFLVYCPGGLVAGVMAGAVTTGCVADLDESERVGKAFQAVGQYGEACSRSILPYGCYVDDQGGGQLHCCSPYVCLCGSDCETCTGSEVCKPRYCQGPSGPDSMCCAGNYIYCDDANPPSCKLPANCICDPSK